MTKFVAPDAKNAGDIALLFAGKPTEEWNQKYVYALNFCGFELRPWDARQPLPEGILLAPFPLSDSGLKDFPITNGWPVPSVIVRRDSLEIPSGNNLKKVLEEIQEQDNLQSARLANAGLRQIISCAVCPVCGDLIADAEFTISENEELIHKECETDGNTAT
jgi:hypothetical protein